MSGQKWQQCLEQLQSVIDPQDYNQWLRPLQSQEKDGALHLFAPNRFVLEWVKENYVERIESILSRIDSNQPAKVIAKVGSARPDTPVRSSKKAAYPEPREPNGITFDPTLASPRRSNRAEALNRDAANGGLKHVSSLNPGFTFDTFVEGKSNQLARAAAMQVAGNSNAYNPLFLYGGVGLGKTHLMQAVGNSILKRNPQAKVLYLHSERFVADMVKALHFNTINEFKAYYRSLDALLIDDIQFFAGKEQSQEEFFHTFNALLEGGHQIILTCDRYPKEIDKMEERLKSRFGWGLTLTVDPPELETRVAILLKKAEIQGINLSYESAFFIAKRIASNVRELEGALKLVTANANFTGSEITPDFVAESLKDLLILHDKQITIDYIQRTVAEYYRIKISDLSSKRRTRSITRPRQVSMALAKELTSHSYPEIGDAFGGRDHTTVLHACKVITQLKQEDSSIREDYNHLKKILSA